MQCPVPLDHTKQHSVATATSQNIKRRNTCYMGATRYLIEAQRFPFPVSYCCLHRKDSLMDGWVHRVFFTSTEK
jgi:hypothetical protein